MEAAQLAEESEITGQALVDRGKELMGLGQDLLRQAALLRGEQEPVFRPATGPSTDHAVSKTGNVVTHETALAMARKLGRFTRIQFEDALQLKGIQTSKFLAKLHDAGDIARGQNDEGASIYDYVKSSADEPPIYQLEMWARATSEAWDLDEAVDQTGLPEEEVVAGITELIVRGIIAAEQLTEVDDLADIDKLATTVYRYVPPVNDAAALERKRLAAVLTVPEVTRGKPVRIRTERKQMRNRSTPGQRSKVINNDRNWERLEAARAERAERNRLQAARQKAKPPKNGRKRK